MPSTFASPPSGLQALCRSAAACFLRAHDCVLNHCTQIRAYLDTGECEERLAHRNYLRRTIEVSFVNNAKQVEMAGCANSF